MPRQTYLDLDRNFYKPSDDYIGVPLQRNVDAGTRLQRNEQEIAAAQQNIQRTAERNAQEFQSPNAQIR